VIKGVPNFQLIDLVGVVFGKINDFVKGFPFFNELKKEVVPVRSLALNTIRRAVRAPRPCRIRAQSRARWERAVQFRMIVKPKGNLLEVINTLGTSAGFSCRLDRWQQKRDKNADDGNYYQQLDEGKANR
jgi:hypothetical protein